ncbi:hypothetical protein [Anabaena azotica]|uniref:hypothetical protein n=1 Tax=Anabaena azotica TaxID=197653 RepID=UPI001A7E6B57|nr:hypothetical protein [Anabaena azotica]
MPQYLITEVSVYDLSNKGLCRQLGNNQVAFLVKAGAVGNSRNTLQVLEQKAHQ